MRRRLPALLLALVACGGPGAPRATVVASPAPSAAPPALGALPAGARLRVDPARSRFVLFGKDMFGTEHRLTFRTWEASVLLAPAPRILARVETASVEVDFPGAKRVVTDHILEVDRFPEATLDATLVPTGGPRDEHAVEGAAEIHGERRTLRFVGRLSAEGAETYRFRTSFVVSRKEFGIHYGPVEPFLRDDVRVLIDAVARPEPGATPAAP